LTKKFSVNIEFENSYETTKRERNENSYQVESIQIGQKIRPLLKENKNPNFLISVIIPLYNEEKSIRKTLTQIPKDKRVEIIVVDDGSTDKSVEEANKSNISFKLIKYELNQGYGNALLTGIKNATGDIIVTMDSDGQHNPNEIFRLIKPILNNKADITIGSRYLGRCNYNVPFHTRIGECIINIILRILFKQCIYNNQGGYRAFKRKTIEIFDKIRYYGFAFTTEILIKATLKKYKIKEVPIILEPRKYGMSKIKLFKLAKHLLLCFGYYFFIKLKNLGKNQEFI